VEFRFWSPTTSYYKRKELVYRYQVPKVSVLLGLRICLAPTRPLPGGKKNQLVHGLVMERNFVFVYHSQARLLG
jgi:hypothetical protein